MDHEEQFGQGFNMGGQAWILSVNLIHYFPVIVLDLKGLILIDHCKRLVHNKDINMLPESATEMA